MDWLPAVLRVLHDIVEENSGDRSVEAHGLLGQIDLNFTCFLTTFLKILGDTKFLSDMLQTSSMNLARAIDLIEALQETFVHYRDEVVFVVLWKEDLWAWFSFTILPLREFPKGSQRQALILLEPL